MFLRNIDKIQGNKYQIAPTEIIGTMFEKYDTLINFQEKGIAAINDRVSIALKSIDDNISLASDKFIGLAANVQVKHLENNLARLSLVSIGSTSRNRSQTELLTRIEKTEQEAHFSDLANPGEIVKDNSTPSKLFSDDMKANAAGNRFSEIINRGKLLYSDYVDAFRADEELEHRLPSISHSDTKAKQVSGELAILTMRNTIGEYASKNSNTLSNIATGNSEVIQQLGEIGIVGVNANSNHLLSNRNYSQLVGAELYATGIAHENRKQFGVGAIQTSEKNRLLVSAHKSHFQARPETNKETIDSQLSLYSDNTASIKNAIGRARTPFTDMRIDGANKKNELLDPSTSVTALLNNINHQSEDATGIQQRRHTGTINDSKAKYPGQFEGITRLAHNSRMAITEQPSWSNVAYLKNNSELQKETLGDSYANNKIPFQSTLNNTSGWQQLLTGKIAGHNYNALEGLAYPTYSASGETNGNKSMANAAMFTSQRAPDGGKNAIVINVNSPLIGKQEYRVGSMQQANEISLRQQEEQLLKILRAAANSAH